MFTLDLQDENIRAIRESVIKYCSAKGYVYICLFGVSCV